MKIYKVCGYYLDNKQEFDSFLITSTSDSINDIMDTEVALPNGLTDDDIFFYGMDVPKEMGNDEFRITEWDIAYEV